MTAATTAFPGCTDEEIDAALGDFPTGHGWMPDVMYCAGSTAPHRARLIRGTPAGPDEAYCGDYASEVEAWRACGETGRRMLAAWESGDTALMALLRASITYAPPPTPRQQADFDDFGRRLRAHLETGV